MSEFKAILEPIADLLEKKNRDYDNSYDLLRDEYGPISYLIRIADKLNRVKQLISNDRLVNNESIEDTLKDIIGYTVLELKYRGQGEATNKVPIKMCVTCRWGHVVGGDLGCFKKMRCRDHEYWQPQFGPEVK